MNTLKASKWITGSQATNICDGSDYAEYIGYPLNLFITIHWALSGRSGNYRQQRKDVQELLRKWFSARQFDFVCVWTTEAGEDGKDVHLHMVAHLPDEIEESELRAYLYSILNSDAPNVLDVQSIEPGTLHRVIRYILKGVHPSLYETFIIPKMHRRRQGKVYGLRCGTSRSIGPSARQKAISKNKTTNKCCKILPKSKPLKPLPHLCPTGEGASWRNSVSPPEDRSFAQDIPHNKLVAA